MIPIELAGHGNRILDPPYRSFDEAVDDIISLIGRHSGLPRMSEDAESRYEISEAAVHICCNARQSDQPRPYVQRRTVSSTDEGNRRHTSGNHG